MGKYYDDNIDQLPDPGSPASSKLITAMNNIAGAKWRALADGDNPIEPWLIFGQAPVLRNPDALAAKVDPTLYWESSWNQSAYDDFFKKTILASNGYTKLPSKDAIKGLEDDMFHSGFSKHKAGDLFKSATEAVQTTTEAITEATVTGAVTIVADALGADPDDTAARLEAAKAAAGPLLSNATEPTYKLVAYMLLNPKAGGKDDLYQYLPVITPPKKAYSYKNWSKAYGAEIQDFKDLLLYLYLEKDSAYKTEIEDNKKAIDDAAAANAADENSKETILGDIKEKIRLRASKRRSNLTLADEQDLAAITAGDDEYFSQMLREQTQCILRLNLGNYVKARKSTAINFKRKSEKFYQDYSKSPSFFNKLTNPTRAPEFLKTGTLVQSSLVPMIRLFKTYYKNGKPDGEYEFPFDGGLDPLQPRSGVGIKSFDWNLIGNDPSTVRNDIEATLTLYFQSFDDLLKKREGKDPISGEVIKDLSYEHLLIRPAIEGLADASAYRGKSGDNNCEKKRIRNLQAPKYYEIKALVGWASPDNKTATGEFEESIKNQQLPLFLTLIDHEFSFTQEGTFELKITYRARIESFTEDPRMDILTTKEQKAKINKVLQEIGELRKTCGSAAQIESREKEVSRFREVDRDLLASTILLGLQEKIYITEIKRIEFVNFSSNTSNLARMKDANFLYQSKKDVEDTIKKKNASIVNQAVARSRSLLVEGVSKTHPAYDEEETKKESEKDRSGGLFSSTYTVEDSTFQSVAIPWFYFGDLVDIVLDHCFNAVEPSKETSEGTLVPGDLRNLSFLFGSFPVVREVVTPTGKGGTGGEYSTPTSYVNILDCPVTVELYNAWFSKRIIEANRASYPLLEFLRDFVEEVVLTTVTRNCFGSGRAFRDAWFVGLHRLVAGAGVGGNTRGVAAEWWRIPRVIAKTSPVSLPSIATTNERIKGKITRDPLGRSPLEALKEWPEVPDDELVASWINLDKMKYDPKTGHPIGDSKISTDRDLSLGQTIKNSWHFMVFYFVSDDNFSAGFGPDFGAHTTRKDRDAEMGVWHLHLARDRGLVKSVNFSKNDSPYLREARIQQDSLNPLAQLASTYNVNLKLFGNTIFWPGQYIFVNPIGFGHDLGDPGNKDSISNQLGLGGYHRVISVKNYIEDGKFETEIEALFEFSGDGCPSLPGVRVPGCEDSVLSTPPNFTKETTTPSTKASDSLSADELGIFTPGGDRRTKR
jgi:hypothetical protein